ARQQFGPLAASSKTIQRLEQKTVPSTRMIPFDYVSTLDIEGKEGNIVEDEININVEGGFVATAMSYSIDIPEVAVPIHLTGNEPRVDLNTIKLTDISSIVLKDGFRVRPDFRRLAFGNGALTSQSRETVRVIFERLNLPENTSFLYKIIDTGTGRDWQNEFEYNIAGLGIANGDRPFRNLAWPMHFLPRSTIRIEVKEIFGRGRLFIVFQGYKMLGKK
ncbi:MAG: hypothetical protein ACE5I1_01160, partial [bacterium]